MKSNLKFIVDKSYQVFEKYNVSNSLDVCTDCCLTVQQESELLGMSVRQIPFELLYSYNTAAKTEKPDIEEFKHFLPRFLELTAELKFLHHSGELVLSRFDDYSKEDWTIEERKLMQDFALEYFRECMLVYPLPECEKVDSVLIMLWKTKINIEMLLADWIIMTNHECILHFNDLIRFGFEEYNPNKLTSGFANQELNDILIKWLNENNTKDRFAEKIEELIMESPKNIEERILSQLSWTYELMKINNAPQ